MKSRSRGLLVALVCSVLFYTGAKAASDKYRLIWNDNAATTITVGWNAASGTNHTVYYDVVDHGTNVSAYANAHPVDEIKSAGGMQNAFARVKGLQPNTKYYFVIGDSEGTSERFWFKTAPDVNTERMSFIGGGDSRNNYTPRINANKLVAKLRADAVFFAGDFTSSSTASQWQDWFDHWQYTVAEDGRMTPIVPARGNHEASNADMVDYFDINSGNYYGVTFGGNLFRMFTLNSEMSVAGDQTNWLAQDLADNSNIIWKSAQYHKPIRPHTSGKSERNDIYDNWAPLFYQHQVRLVIECDAHTVKTTWPVIPSTEAGNDMGFIRDDENGTVFVGEGCWGAPLRTNDDDKSWTRASGVFNQFKWFFVDRSKIELRTIAVDNADQVGSVTDADRFTPPANLDIWNPGNGSGDVVVIEAPGTPSVEITAPGAGNYFDSPQQITISATAMDPNGSVTKVDFYADGSLIGTANASPYQVNWTPSQAGIYELVAEVTDNEGEMATSKPRLVYVDQLDQTPYPSTVSGDGHPIPGVIEAVNYDSGGEGKAYHDTDTGNNGNGSRQEDVDTETNDGGETVGWIAAGEWLEYIVNVETQGTYELQVRVASMSGGGPFSISFGGEDKTGSVNVEPTGDWSAFTTKTISDIYLKEGKTIMRLNAKGGAFNIGKMTYELLEADTTSTTDTTGTTDTTETTTFTPDWSKAKPQMKVYPNPVAETFVVEINNLPAGKEVKIELMNYSGQTVMEMRPSVKNGAVNQRLTVPRKLAAGTYFVRATAGEYSFINSVVITR